KADQRAEEMLYDDLSKARPGYGFVGEEGGAREGTDKSHTWIVDPLDGTTNFLHSIPQFAISIGLRREDTVTASSMNACSPAGCRISAAAIMSWRAGKWPRYRTALRVSAASARRHWTWPL